MEFTIRFIFSAHLSLNDLYRTKCVEIHLSAETNENDGSGEMPMAMVCVAGKNR